MKNKNMRRLQEQSYQWRQWNNMNFYITMGGPKQEPEIGENCYSVEIEDGER